MSARNRPLDGDHNRDSVRIRSQTAYQAWSISSGRSAVPGLARNLDRESAEDLVRGAFRGLGVVGRPSIIDLAVRRINRHLSFDHGFGI